VGAVTTRRPSERDGTVVDAIDRGLFEAMFATATVGMMVAELDSTIVVVNQALCDIVGLAACELVGSRFLDLVEPGDGEDDDSPDTLFVADVRAGVRHSSHCERPLLRSDGSRVWVRVHTSVVQSDSSSGVVFAQIVDIDQHKTDQVRSREQLLRLMATNADLERKATHDALTGLPNRLLLMDRLRLGLRAMSRNGTPLAVLYVDLDEFKAVNDSLGHAVGDQLLVDVARALCHVVRPADTVARISGDEFIIVCGGIACADDVVAIADRIMARFESPFGGDEPLCVSASIGFVVSESSLDDPLDLVAAADAAMYRAKQLGRPVRALR